MNWETIATHAFAFLIGFVAWRTFEWFELSGARMRQRRALAEVKHATAAALAKAREIRQIIDIAGATAALIDNRQLERATRARAFEDELELVDQTDAIAPTHEEVARLTDGLVVDLGTGKVRDVRCPMEDAADHPRP